MRPHVAALIQLLAPQGPEAFLLAKALQGETPTWPYLQSEDAVANARSVAVALYGNFHMLARLTPLASDAAVSPALSEQMFADLQSARHDTERALQGFIRNSYREQLLLGRAAAGVTTPPGDAESKVLERLRRNEYVFVERFLDDIVRGDLRMPLERRAALYGNATREAFWLGFLYANLSTGRYLRWVMRPDAEHCPDCAYLSGTPLPNLSQYTSENSLPFGGRWGNGTYSAQELAYLAVVPQSGTLACTTNCKCVLQEVEKPASAPRGRMQRTPYLSISPKALGEPYAGKAKRFASKRVSRTGKVM